MGRNRIKKSLKTVFPLRWHAFLIGSLQHVKYTVLKRFLEILWTLYDTTLYLHHWELQCIYRYCKGLNILKCKYIENCICIVKQCQLLFTFDKIFYPDEQMPMFNFGIFFFKWTIVYQRIKMNLNGSQYL